MLYHRAWERERRGMRRLIAGNWKMNGLRADVATRAAPLREAAEALACDLLVCPPVTLLQQVATALDGSRVAVGAQDCHPDPDGPHTGDISAAMLRDAGATWAVFSPDVDLEQLGAWRHKNPSS